MIQVFFLSMFVGIIDPSIYPLVNWHRPWKMSVFSGNQSSNPLFGRVCAGWEDGKCHKPSPQNRMEVDGMQFFGNSPIGKQHMFSKRVPDIFFGGVIGSKTVQTANFDGTSPFESGIVFWANPIHHGLQGFWFWGYIPWSLWDNTLNLYRLNLPKLLLKFWSSMVICSLVFHYIFRE